MATGHKVDRYSPTWIAVETKLRADIESIRDQLEYDQTPDRTANLRGQLTNARQMLQLGAEEVVSPSDD